MLAVHYGAALYLLDFRADPEGSRLIINGWVAEQNEDRIKDLIPKDIIKPNTRLVLTNAIYFNAAWQNPFETSDTADGTFTRADGSEVTVPMMSQTARMQYAAGNEAGPEAAAATAVIMGESAVPRMEEITLNRPFLFLIWDRPTGAILFLGRVVDPS